MQKISNALLRFGALSFAVVCACTAVAHAQTTGNADFGQTIRTSNDFTHNLQIGIGLGYRF